MAVPPPRKLWPAGAAGGIDSGRPRGAPCAACPRRGGVLLLCARSDVSSSVRARFRRGNPGGKGRTRRASPRESPSSDPRGEGGGAAAEAKGTLRAARDGRGTLRAPTDASRSSGAAGERAHCAAQRGVPVCLSGAAFHRLPSGAPFPSPRLASPSLLPTVFPPLAPLSLLLLQPARPRRCAAPLASRRRPRRRPRSRPRLRASARRRRGAFPPRRPTPSRRSAARWR